MADKSPLPKKSTGGRTSTKTPGLIYSKTAYFFPDSTVELLHYIGRVLRKRAEPVNATSALMEDGLSRQVVALCKQKNIIIPEDLMPTDNPDLCTKLRGCNTAIAKAATDAAANS